MRHGSLSNILSRTVTGLCAAVGFITAFNTVETQAQARNSSAGQFDHYVLSLTWSPSFCAASSNNHDNPTCTTRVSRGFVLHGLWPQYHNGYPEFCGTNESGRVPGYLARNYYDLIPSAGLIGYQWRKHGSCSGLSQRDYLETMRAAVAKVQIPAVFRHPDKPIMIAPRTLEARFLEANPGLPPDAFSISCSNRALNEIRVCLSKDLKFQRCEQLERRSCRSDRIQMPAAR